jgi:hypothetical protein
MPASPGSRGFRFPDLLMHRCHDKIPHVEFSFKALIGEGCHNLCTQSMLRLHEPDEGIVIESFYSAIRPLHIAAV